MLTGSNSKVLKFRRTEGFKALACESVKKRKSKRNERKSKENERKSKDMKGDLRVNGSKMDGKRKEDERK